MDGPPPPPPHGEQQQNKRGGLPDGKYDIFVIPPNSAGSGFLYLPSMQPHRNSFILGCACTTLVFLLYNILAPVVRSWFLDTLEGGGARVIMLIVAVGGGCWLLGKVQAEGVSSGQKRADTSEHGRSYSTSSPPQTPRSGSKRVPTPPPQFNPQATPDPQQQTKSSWQKPQPSSDGKTSWEKAREETRKREEERKRAAELQRRREEVEKKRQQQREKETLERLEREWKEKKAAEEKATSEKTKADAEQAAQRAKAAAERAEREAKLESIRAEREAREAATRADADKRRREADEARASNVSAGKRPPMPTAKTERGDDDAYSFRPYDRSRSSHQKSGSGGSVFSDDASSYAPSATTAKTTPPPSTRGPYVTKDPDKIIIKGCYSFNNAFMRTPISQLISGQGNVTDGLILRITTEGLFIDDDVRSAPQREWDVKAWTLKQCESIELLGHHVLRASIRDQEGKKYVFIMSPSEGWKASVGLQRLKKSGQSRALAVSGMPSNEAKVLLEALGWV